jgi:CRP/FNR family transcriptional regulator, cyclic AMP receptor protein
VSRITTDMLCEHFPGLAAELDPGDLEALTAAFQRHDAAAGEALVAEGTTTDELFLVCDGSLEITVAAAGGEHRLAQVGPGAYFGEVSLLDPGPAGASVVTDQGAVTLRLSRPAFEALRASNERAGAALTGEVLHSLSTRMKAAMAHLGEAADR